MLRSQKRFTNARAEFARGCSRDQRGRGGISNKSGRELGGESCSDFLSIERNGARPALTHVRPTFTLMTDVKLDPGSPATAESDQSIDRSGDMDNAQEQKKRKKEREASGGRFIYTAEARRLYSGHRSARPLPRRVKSPQIVPLYASNVFHPIPRSISDSRRVSISMPRLCAYLLSRLRPSWYSTGFSRRAGRRVRSFP